jgi:hypothetical protein
LWVYIIKKKKKKQLNWERITIELATTLYLQNTG